MIKITQFRYYGRNNPKNYPLDLFKNDSSDNMLVKYSPLRIKIQTIPGTKIYFTNMSNPFYIEQTGILDLDCDNHNLKFSGLHLDETSLNTITNLPNGHFIMTIVYKAMEEEKKDNGN